MELNQVFEVEIIDDNHNGNGIFKVDEFPVFVRGVITGDIVKVKITEINKKYAIGEIISFIKKSSNHEEVKCPYYEECGGCDLLHITYDREIYLKQEYIKRLFKDYACSITFFDRYNYRNKVTLHVKDGKLGFFKEGSNELVCISKCLLLDDKINDLIEVLEKSDLDNISQIVIKKGTNKLLLSVKGYIANEDLLKLIKNKNIGSIYQDDLLIYGDPYIKNNFGSVTYNINNNSFFQVNNECAVSLYEKVKEYVGKCDRLLDLYCGMASIGIYLKDNVKEIVGIEINKDSVNCGKLNIKENNVSNYNLVLGDASMVDDDFDVIVVDPPRSGLSKKVIKILNDMESEKLIYVSCNPSTLKRDIDLLNSYELKEISAFNMFPGTKHVETIAFLTRKK